MSPSAFCWALRRVPSLRAPIPRTDATGKAYILLVGADAVAPDPARSGLYVGPNTELIDLRIAAPSVFVRPHAQHGLLMRMKGKSYATPTDYSSQIRGVLEIDLSDALEWFGNSTALSTHIYFLHRPTIMATAHCCRPFPGEKCWLHTAYRGVAQLVDQADANTGHGFAILMAIVGALRTFGAPAPLTLGVRSPWQ